MRCLLPSSIDAGWSSWDRHYSPLVWCLEGQLVNLKQCHLLHMYRVQAAYLVLLAGSLLP